MIIVYFILKSLLLTSALRDYEYIVCRFQFLYSLISNI